VTRNRNTALELAGTLVALFVGLVAMSAVAAAVVPVDLRLGLLFGEIALVLPLCALAPVLGHGLRRMFAIADVPGRTIALAFLCGGTLWLLSAGVVEAQSAVWPLPAEVAEAFRALHAKLRPTGVLATLGSILALAVAPGCAEELAFRGALQGALEKIAGPRGAILVSAVLFGLIHLQPAGYRVPFAILLGLALGALRRRTGSVVPGMIAHGVLNTTTLLVTPFLDEGATTPETIPLAQALGLLAMGAVLSAALIRSMAAVDSREF
jgi:membrane protease YdiL (CAAX protease family)